MDVKRVHKIRNRLAGWRLLVVPLAVVAVLLLANPASAHYVYRTDLTYASDTDCTYGYSEISHGSYGYGYWKDDTTALYNSPLGNCSYRFRRPPGYLADRILTMYYRAGTWYLCDATNWWYNSTSTAEFILTRTWSNKPHCGDHYYQNNALGFDYNGGWHGGPERSGSHYLPTSPS